MTALYIAAGILLLLAALLLVRVQVGVSYIGDLRVELRLGPLRLDLTPEPAAPDAPLALLRPVHTQGQRRLRGPRPNRRAVRTHQRAGGGAHPRRARAAPFQASRGRVLRGDAGLFVRVV